jgi:acyl-coenzyme A synthetase/AMP-(fatty) acid ligase
MAMMERFDVHRWAALVKQHRPKTMGAPPPVLRMILDAGITHDHFESVEAYVTGSAPVSPDVAAEFHRRYSIPVLVSYGATEFLSAVTGWTLDLWREFGEEKLGSVGRAHPGVGLRVVDPDTGAPLGPDEIGLLEVDPPRRAGNLAPGWLRTADRARIDRDGFLWILGRSDDVIIRGGFKVDLVSLERSIAGHPGVAAAAVVGLPDERLGSVPGAVIVTVSGARITADDVTMWLRDKVAPYAVPTVMRVVSEIPLTPTMKPDRRAVVALLG